MRAPRTARASRRRARVPLSVIPAEAGIHEHGRTRFSTDRVHGSRIKSGMTNEGVEDGPGFPETGEARVPLSVIPAEAGIHEHGRIRFSTGRAHGSRIKSGMTNDGVEDGPGFPEAGESGGPTLRHSGGGRNP